MAKVGEAVRHVEVEALRFVTAYERSQGRDLIEVSRRGCDIISSGRKIEVKGRGAPGWNGSARLVAQVYDAVKESPEFFLYVVTNIDSGDPRKYELYIVSKEDILSKGEQWRGPWVVKIPKRERDGHRATTGTADVPRNPP